MKRIPLTIALLLAFAAHAQDSTSSGSASSNSSSSPIVSNGGTSTSASGANVNGVASQSNPTNMQGVSVNYYAPGSGRNADGSPAVQSAALNPNGTPANGSGADGVPTQKVVNESRQKIEGGTDSTMRNINEGTSTQRVEYSGTQTVKNVPSIQMSGPASGPCTGVSGGVGLSGPGWGIGVNGSAVMDDCRLRENTRVLGMAMQSIDGNANPQERGEVTVIFMDAVRALGEYNKTIYNRTNKDSK